MKSTPLIIFSETPVIIGKNDTGKSSILHAISLFFGKRTLVRGDLSLECSEQETPVEIEIRFCNIEDNVKKELQDKRLLSESGELVIRKLFTIDRKKPDVQLIVYDFEDNRFRNLRSKKEKELNSLGNECGLRFTQAGRSITNERKIQQLVEYAKNQGFQEEDVPITPDSETYENIEKLLPDFTLFPSYMTLDIDQAQFQNPFSDMIVNQIQIDNQLTDGIPKKSKNCYCQCSQRNREKRIAANRCSN